MVGSEDSFDYIPELSITNEIKSIPIACWKDVCLSTIWIPSNLLPNRYEPQNTQVTKGIFHRLEKRDLSKQVPGFSVYVNCDEEIFTSDDEDCFNLDTEEQIITTECFKNESDNVLSVRNCTFPNDENNSVEVIQNDKVIQNKHASSQNCNIINEANSNESSENCNQSNSQNCKQTQLRKIDSHVSLNEILDDTPEVNIRDYVCNFKAKNQFSDTENKTANKKKKKGKKVVGLDEFLSDYTQADLQDACCQDYFNKLLTKPNNEGNVHIKSKAEFPGLEKDEIKFVHSEKPGELSSQFSSKSDMVTVTKSEAMSDGIISSINEASFNTCGKIVIENIPGETSEEDIQSLLCGYGKINRFSLEPVGKFQTATVEIEIECDIDWIIECLNGSEPFGASTSSLKCYEQP